MADWKYSRDVDLDPRHFQFERQCRDFYPPEPRETHSDKLADRVVVIAALLVIALILAGALR
jgi:hypothetical protein